MTLFNDESTILDEASIDYENKVVIDDNYGDDMYAIKNRIFYFCAPGSLALLIHPHSVNFCSLFPTPLPETLITGYNGRCRRVNGLTVNSDEWGRVGWCRCSTIGPWFRWAVPCIKCLRAPPRQKPAMHAPNKPACMRRPSLHALMRAATMH